MKRWCVRHNQACDYANSNGDCNVSACQTVIGGDRKMTNREWLNTLSNEEFVEVLPLSCSGCPARRICDETVMPCDAVIRTWLNQQHKEDNNDKS